jgi:rubrerythrin
MSTRLDLSKLSLMDALDLAKLIELEAHHRYQMFASQLGRGGGYDPGAFFTTMAENEAKHGRELEARRKALFGDAPARVTLDDLFDVEVPGITDPEVRALFTELRDEETEHVEMLREEMAKLPPSASVEVEFDLDESPYL